MSDELSNATRIAALEDKLKAEIEDHDVTLADNAVLRVQIADRNAYNERLLAENVRLSNDAADVRKELEQYRMRLAGALIASEGGDGQPSDALEYLRTCPTITSVTKVRHELDNARAWIDGQDVRSDFPNATAMRETLESLRQSIYAACAGTGCLNAHELRVALDRERERCGVLELEVKAWHAAEHLQRDEWHAEFGALAEARWNTARTHALDAAKFVGGG